MKWQTIPHFCVLITLIACGSATVEPTQHANRLKTKVLEEPCWVKRPSCEAKDEDAALYFAGQSEKPLANWGRPSRESVHSAQQDAEQQYARFLGVKIKSSTFLQSVLSDEHYQEQFAHTVSSKFERKVSDLVKVDEYFVPYQQTDEGQPLWTVYVLIKVSKATVAKHRAAIAEEEKKKAETPPPQDKWTAEVFNIDDFASIYVNDTQVRDCGFSRSCTVDLSKHFRSGTNHVRLAFANRFGAWTYGYKVRKNDELMYQGRCGQVWVYGCRWDVTTGVRYTFDFKVELP